MNDELRKFFMEIVYQDHPASIQAEIDKDGELGIHIEGRGIELLVLSFKIAENVGKKLKLSKRTILRFFRKDGMRIQIKMMMFRIY